MKRMLWSKILVLAAFFCVNNLYSAVILYGDEHAGAHATFSVPLGAWAYSELNGHMYVGAGAAGANNFALASLQKGADALMPLAPAKAYIDGKPDQTNPLHNAPIAHMKVHSVDGNMNNYYDTLIVVPAEAEKAADIYVLEDCVVTKTMHMESLQHVLDACREPSSGIVGLTTTGRSRRTGIFAAVKPHGASTHFGDFGSGIALISMSTAPAGLKRQYVLLQIDAELQKFAVDDTKTGTVKDERPFVRAARCDKALPAFAFNQELASLGDVVDLCWDSTLHCLYIGVTATTAGACDARARSLAVAHFAGDSSKLYITPVICDADCEKEHGVLHCQGAHKTVATHFVRTMRTTTGVSYLVTVGGSEHTDVCAFPLLANGTIASPYQDKTLRVGNGKLAYGQISSISIVRDAIFVTVGDAAPGKDAGVFFSQAIFDEQGAIKGWTHWQRAVADYSPAFGAAFDATSGFWTTLTGADKTNIVALKQTRWLGNNEASCDVATVLNKAMPAHEGGVLGLYEFPEFSLLAATGKGKVMLIKPELESLMVETKVAVDAQTKKILKREKQTKQSRVNELPEHYVFADDALKALGKISCIEIVDTGDQRYIWAGGMAGLAVGALDQDTLVFKKVGSYKNVRKLIFDDGYLFVLTNQQLDRLDVTCVESPAVMVAKAQTGILKGAFSDVIISNGFAVLATGNGLFCSQPLSDVRQNSHAHMHWKEIDLVPESVVPSLFAITQTGKESDVARGCGGNVYALFVSPSGNTGSVYRLSIKPTEQGVFADPIMVGASNPGYVTELGGYRHMFVTDGALFMQANNRNLKQAPLCMSGISKRALGIQQLNVPFEDASVITRIMRSDVLGTWILSGDFGVVVNA